MLKFQNTAYKIMFPCNQGFMIPVNLRGKKSRISSVANVFEAFAKDK